VELLRDTKESFFSGKTYHPTGDEDLLSAWGHVNNVFTYPDEKRFVKAQIRAGQYHLANYCERYGITAMTSLPKAKAMCSDSMKPFELPEVTSQWADRVMLMLEARQYDLALACMTHVLKALNIPIKQAEAAASYPPPPTAVAPSIDRASSTPFTAAAIASGQPPAKQGGDNYVFAI
jgi:hypothetical protein